MAISRMAFRDHGNSTASCGTVPCTAGHVASLLLPMKWQEHFPIITPPNPQMPRAANGSSFRTTDRDPLFHSFGSKFVSETGSGSYSCQSQNTVSIPHKYYLYEHPQHCLEINLSSGHTDYEVYHLIFQAVRGTLIV